MAQFNDDNLTEEELAIERARLREIAGPAIPSPPTNIEIPGPPNEAAARRGRDIRQTVARDILGRLEGTESKEFLDKLRLNANLGSENAATPANAASGFTNPLPSPDRLPAGQTEIGASVDRLSPQQPDINLAGISPASFDDPAAQLDLPPGRPLEFLGPASEADLARAGLLAEPAPPGFFDRVGDAFGDAQRIGPAAAQMGEIPFGAIGDAFSNIQGELGGLPPPLNIGDSLSQTDARMAALDEQFREEAELRGDVSGATEAGLAVNRFGRQVGVGAGGLASDFAEGAGNFFEPISDFFGGVAGGEIETNPPPQETPELDPTRGVETPGAQNETSNDGTAKEQARAANPIIGPLQEPPVSETFLSNTSGQESDGGLIGQTQFSDLPQGGGISINNPAIDGPPLPGTEIIRGTNRTFQPFNEEDIGFPALGEIPVGDDRIEQLLNTGFPRAEVPDVIRAEAQTRLAASNAARATQVRGPDGKLYEGFNIINADGSVDTVRLANLAPLGTNMVQTTAKDKVTTVAGETVESTRAVFYEMFEDADGVTTLKPMRITTAIDPQMLRDNNPGEAAAADAEAQRLNPNMTGSDLEAEQHRLLVLILSSDQ